MSKGGNKVYQLTNVYDAAIKRLSILFDEFENIVISVSGGKDSTALFYLTYTEALKRNKKINVFFLDQEAEYQSTIEVIKDIMSKPNIKPFWFQVPIQMTNATSYYNAFLYAWGPGENWMREKDPIAIHSASGYPERFYPFFNWFEKQWDIKKTCFLVGLRAEESLNRYRAVIKNPGFKGLKWTSNTNGLIKAYPLYDWTFEDIWHYIAINNIKYNRIYDFMYAKGYNIQNVRVSNLIHEHAFKCLSKLPEFEPETYDKLIKRVPGVHVAARYAHENTIYSAKQRPERFKTWKEYRDFLLETTTSIYKDRFIERFRNQEQNEYIFRQQCRQILMNDWENNINIVKKKDNIDKLAKWREIL